MPYVGSQLTVTSTIQAVVVGDGSAMDPVPAVVTNQDATNSVFLGGSTVDTTGYELKATRTITVTAMPGETLYAVSAGSVRVDVLKGRQ